MRSDRVQKCIDLFYRGSKGRSIPQVQHILETAGNPVHRKHRADYEL